MEPLSTGTAALATIISLIGQFISGRDSAKSQDFDEFMQWLAENNHSELKSLIESNHSTTISIKAILHQNQEALSESLNRIDNALAAITTALAGFGELSKSIRPNAVLSHQALSILRQLENRQSSQFTLQEIWGGGSTVVTLDGEVGLLNIDEVRFLESDLQTLVQHRLLLQMPASRNERIFTVTRSASELAKSLPE